MSAVLSMESALGEEQYFGKRDLDLSVTLKMICEMALEL